MKNTMACMVLKNIGPKRNDVQEAANRGKSLEVLPENEHPCCTSERGFFMAPFPLTRTKNHPYNETSPETHGHFRPTILRHPSYAADAIPFLWMRKDNLETLRDRYQIDLDPSREPKMNFNTGWVQQGDNHAGLLNCFFGHVKPGESLCFFYAKRTPLTEDTRRIIIGVGKVNHVGGNTEYNYSVPEKDAPLRSLLWERLVQHSIRPNTDGSFAGGFLLPYHEALAYAEKDPDFDPASVVAFSPADRQNEFSFVSEHVTHDGAIGALLSCSEALRNAAKHLEGPWDRYQKWIDTELGQLWKLRGPCPGLGAALTAFGIQLGTFVAYDLAKHIGVNEDPWLAVDSMFKEPKKLLSADAARQIDKDAQADWSALPDERRSLLKLLSRFEISAGQAALMYEPTERANAKITITDADILQNPYRLFETTRDTVEPISVMTVDRGVFPDPVVLEKHPLPEPSRLDTGTDIRRVRALVIQTLEGATADGNTLLPRDEIITTIRELETKPGCPVTTDRMSLAEKSFAREVEIVPLADKSPAFQLSRLVACRNLIRTQVTNRIGGKPHVVNADWLALLADPNALGPVKEGDERERRSRTEKAAALKVLAESRISVLNGSAGTGKTTLLAVLCGQEVIANGGVLLLAPTGKARVRMEQAAKKKKLNLTGQTVAGYLMESGRYVPETGQYRMLGPGAPKGKVVDTVIVDETSMMTEEMFAAVLEAVAGAKRIILVGDYRQLPPIGAGRPLVDIVKRLQPEKVESLFPRVCTGYAELTFNWRQDPSAPDTRLAAWFSGVDPGPGEESLFRELQTFGAEDRIQVFSWKNAEECHSLLLKVLQTELKLTCENDVLNFDKSLGGTEFRERCYFSRTREKDEIKNAAESWQILSPVKALPHGVAGLNRLIHKIFRSQWVEQSRKRFRKILPALGPEEIVYGDKVINVRNQRRWWEIYPEENCSKYVANGEIGIAVGQYKGQQAKYKGLPWKLEVEFTSQPRFTYGYTKSDFRDEGDTPLELAYALTVHKAQGSEFGTVILVLPNPCRLLTREMLYTALTRQVNRIVVLFQGNPAELRNYTRSEFSETARRLTNLFTDPEPITHKDRRYDGKHIHRTKRGELVMSKSEVIIANELLHRQIEYSYEKDLTYDGIIVCHPDFTIDDAATGLTVYWEHCGMLMDDEYRKRWERKKAWYHKNGVTSFPERSGPNGILVETSDDPKSGFDCTEINKILDELFGKSVSSN